MLSFFLLDYAKKTMKKAQHTKNSVKDGRKEEKDFFGCTKQEVKKGENIINFWS